MGTSFQQLRKCASNLNILMSMGFNMIILVSTRQLQEGLTSVRNSKAQPTMTGNGMEAGPGGSWSQCILSQGAERDEFSHSAYCPLFIQAGTPLCGLGLPTFGMGFPSTVKSFQTHSHGRLKRCVVMLTLKSIKLTMTVNQHECLIRTA